MGYGAEADDVQRRYLAKDYAGAAAAVPASFADATSLLGPQPRIAERMAAFAACGVTTLAVSPLAGTLSERLAALHTAAEAARLSGVAA
jgi:hypothetical protein